MQLSDELNVFICNQCKERGPAAASGFSAAGYSTTIFQGGYEKMSQMDAAIVAAAIPTNALITLILDSKDSPKAKDNYVAAYRLLASLSRELQTADTPEIMARLRGLSINPEAHFPSSYL